jgi:predicted negative regulator of RcsB-dependent stress response
MSTQSLFSRKNIETQQLDKRRGLMEELNLPPDLIAFIRRNSKNLQIALISAVVLVLAVIFYDYYAATQEQKGSSLLATGMQTESTEQKIQILENVINDYGRTDAARWAKLELAHLDYKEGRFEAAAAKYKVILESLSADNSLVPLTRLNLAQSYEQAGQYDQAITQYGLLKKSKGFMNQAYWGLGRLYMVKDDPNQARQAYEELFRSLGDNADPEIKAEVEAKLATLDAGNPVISSQPEEKKE